MGLAAVRRSARARRRARLVRAVAHARTARSQSRTGRPTRCSPRGRCSACARPARPAPGSLAYLQSQERSLQSSNDIAIVALAEQALGGDTTRAPRAAARAAERPDRRDAQLDVLGRARARALARRRRRASCSRTRRRAAASRGTLDGQPDSNDTAAALEALRVAHVHGAPVARAVAFLRTFQNRDGGFELTQRSRLRRAVDRLGDPGLRRRG